MAQATVATPSAAYNLMAQDWEIIDALLGGTRSMRAKQVAFLPQDALEANVDYVNRLNRSFLKPFLRNAIANARGAVFRFEIDTSGIVARLAPLLDDIDLLGNDLTTFLSMAFGDMLTYGHCHLLAAFPTMVPGSTLADVRAEGARPYAVRLDPRNVFSWRKEDTHGAEKLAEVRFYERAPTPGSEWDADSSELRVRVLRPGEWQEWAIASSRPPQDDPSILTSYAQVSAWQMIDSGKISLPEIPWTTIYGDRIDFMVSRPVFMDLAWLNVQHWQAYSDYCNILHVAQVPFLFASGMKAEDSPIIVGVSSAVRADDPNAKMMWVEHTGKAIESGRQHIVDLESAMEQLGSALMSEDKPGDELATVKSIDTAEKQANIGGIVRALEDGANQFLWQMGQWLGLDDVGEITISRPIAMGGDENMAEGQDDQPSQRNRPPRSGNGSAEQNQSR